MRTLIAAPKTEVKELMFLISPNQGVTSDVRVLKDDVHYLTGKRFESQDSKAHITLFTDRYKETEIERVLAVIEERLQNFNAFEVIIKDFGVFHHGSNRTIYMDIVNKYRIRDIFESIKNTEDNFTPHITIAKNLPAEDFLKCWPYFKSLHYSQHFRCERITVLSKSGKRWGLYKEIMLNV